MDKLATVFTKVLLCVKGICEGGIFTGTVLATGIAYDWALELANKEKVFGPLIGKLIKASVVDLLGEEQTKQLQLVTELKKITDEKLKHFRRFSNITKSNQEIELVI